MFGDVEVDEILVGGKRTWKQGRGADGRSLVVIVIELMKKGYWTG